MISSSIAFFHNLSIDCRVYGSMIMRLAGNLWLQGVAVSVNIRWNIANNGGLHFESYIALASRCFSWFGHTLFTFHSQISIG